MGRVDKIVCWILAWILLKLPSNYYLKLLKKLETGVALFCWRNAIAAEKSQDEVIQNLAPLVRELAESEYGHAQVFAHLTGDRFLMNMPGLMEREIKDSPAWGTIDWAKEPFQADGISYRYLSARVFFQGTASSYDWLNKLAFMSVLEDFQVCFYEQLIAVCERDLNGQPFIKQLRLIQQDEQQHAIEVAVYMRSLAPDDICQDVIKKWQTRKYWAILFLPLDLVWFAFLSRIN